MSGACNVCGGQHAEEACWLAQRQLDAAVQRQLTGATVYSVEPGCSVYALPERDWLDAGDAYRIGPGCMAYRIPDYSTDRTTASALLDDIEARELTEWFIGALLDLIDDGNIGYGMEAGEATIRLNPPQMWAILTASPSTIARAYLQTFENYEEFDGRLA